MLSKLKEGLIFGILPFYILIFLFAVNKNNSPVHASSSDPAYAYLFNSLNIASGFLKSGHWDHPGATAQVSGAVILRINHFIYGENDIITDVLSDPEFYLQKNSAILITILSLIVLLLGVDYYIRTGDMISALGIQTMLLVSHNGFYLADKLIPEYFLCVGMMIMVYLCFLEIHYRKLGESKSFTRIGLAVVTGFLFASKFSIFPVLILPLFFLKGIKQFLIHAIIAITTFSICVFPIWTRLDNFFDFVVSIIEHDGRYGSGEKQVINMDTFYDNLLTLLTFNTTFTVVFAAAIIFTIINFKKLINIERWFNIAITMAVLIQFVIVAKHFSKHYFLPAEAMVLPMLFVALRPTYSTLFKSGRSFRAVPLTLTFLLIPIIAYNNYWPYTFFEDAYHPVNETLNFLKGNEDIAVVTDHSVFTVVPSAAMLFGAAYSRERGYHYRMRLNEINPRTYVWDPEGARLYDFINRRSVAEVINKEKRLFFVETEHFRGSIVNFLSQYNFDLDTSLVYYNPIIHDKIFLVESKGESFGFVKTADCDFELLDENRQNFLTSDSSLSMNGTHLIDKNTFRSGETSTCFNSEVLYGFNWLAPVEKGKNYRVELYTNGPMLCGQLVVSADNVPGYYYNSHIPTEQTDDWDMLRVDFYVPDNFPDSVVKIYSYNPCKAVVCFDDLSFYELK
ncbi:MAG: hypothetical protein HKN22_04150 [Bacteroidia bacterium]|nr:hypothetical protein [Bacteroidia bacterium]